jgi:replicative DNA helicase
MNQKIWRVTPKKGRMSELPYSREVEEDCIAGFLFFPGWIRDPDFEPQLKAEDFYDWKCRTIFNIMLKLNSQHLTYWGEDAVRAQLANEGVLTEIGEDYVHTLARRAYFRSQQDRHIHEPQHYAVIVKDYSLRRAQLLKAQKLAAEALDPARLFYGAQS